jgi:hypothetical protein
MLPPSQRGRDCHCLLIAAVFCPRSAVHSQCRGALRSSSITAASVSLAATAAALCWGLCWGLCNARVRPRPPGYKSTKAAPPPQTRTNSTCRAPRAVTRLRRQPGRRPSGRRVLGGRNAALKRRRSLSLRSASCTSNLLAGLDSTSLARRPAMSLPLQARVRSGTQSRSPMLRSPLLAFLLLLLGAGAVFASDIVPANESMYGTKLNLRIQLPTMVYSVNITPLTLEAGQQVRSTHFFAALFASIL